MKKQTVDRFVQSGDADKAAKLISATYLLMNMSKYYMDEAEELCSRHNCNIGELKQHINKTSHSWTLFKTAFNKLIGKMKSQTAENVFSDFNLLQKELDKFFKLHQE